MTKSQLADLNIVTIIPARGGSKGVPGKNIRALNGVPLLAHSILAAKNSQFASKVFVTSDSDEIGSVAVKYGAEFITRPAQLAADESTSESALLHALDSLDNAENIDYVVFLQCTSPFRHANDIDDALTVIIRENADSLLSVIPSHTFLWERREAGAESINYDHKNRPRRQDMQPQFRENGSIYIFKPWVLKTLNNRLGGNIALYEMDETSSIDIDSELDFLIAEQLAVHAATKQ